MGLNVYGFQSDFKPHLGHQFKVVISGTNSDAQPDITSQLVKSIKLPEMGMNVEKRNYGTTSLGLSVFTFAEQSIDITFTETESFDVLNTFIACLGWTSNQAINHFYIFVEEYDETMLNLIRKYVYTARVCEVGQPSWQRTGSASFIELTVKFLVLSANISDVSTDNKTPFAVVAQAVSPTMDQQADVIGAATDYGEDYASTTEKLAAAEIAYKKDLQKQYAEQKTKENSRVNDAVKQLQEKYQDPNEKVKKTKADLEKAKKEQEEAKKELEDTKKIYDTFMSDETKKEKSESLNNTLKALDASGNPLYKGKTLDNMSSDELKAFLKEYSDGDANINNDMVSKIGNKAYLESLIDLKKAEEKVAKADENAMLAEGRVTNAEADLAAYNAERKKVREQGTPKAQSFGANNGQPSNEEVLAGLNGRVQSANGSDATAVTPTPAGTTTNNQYFSSQTVSAKKGMAASNKLAADNNISALSVEIAKKKLGNKASEADVIAEAKRIDSERAKSGAAYNGMNSAYNKTWTYEYEMGSKLNDKGEVKWGGLRATATNSSKAKKLIDAGEAEIKNGKLVYTEKGFNKLSESQKKEKHAAVGGQVYDGSDLGGDGKGTGIDCSGLASVVVADTTGSKISQVSAGTSGIVDKAVATGQYKKTSMSVDNLKQGDIVSNSGSHVVTIAYTEGDYIYAYESTGTTGAQLKAYTKKEFKSKYGKASVASINA